MASLTKRSRTTRRTDGNASNLFTAGLGSALVPGPAWSSFEKLRVQGASALSQIKLGAVGTLTSQGQQFRLLHESDFQQLVGLARETDRTRQGLRVIRAAVRTVQEHPDSSSLNTLVEAALLLTESPVLPIRRRLDALYPEDEKWLEAMQENGEDEVELDPKAVRRPLATGSNAGA